MKYWFTADLHLFHDNIRKYCNRPFDTLEEMNDSLIRHWNERVKEEDIVFHIGDFLFRNSPGGKKGEGEPVKSRDIEKLLNGKIIHCRGNHDRNNSTKTIVERMVIKYGHHRVNLVHNPAYVDTNYKVNFVGHVHSNWKIKRIRRGFGFTDAINVGVDVWNFMPVTFEEIFKRYNRWKKELKREFKST